MRTVLRRIFFVFLALDVCALVAVWRMEGTRFAATLIDVRNALFTTFVSDPKQLELPPAELAASGFVKDSKEEIAKWRRTLDDLPLYHELFGKLEQTTSTVEKAKLIALSFSRNGTPTYADGSPIRPYDKSADLLLKFSTIMEPRGCCSDHVEVFVALGNVTGLDCMKLDCAHVTCSFYAPELKKWIWIDPEFAIMAKGPDGEYLSPSEMFRANRRHEKVDYEFFGLPVHMFSKMDPHDHELYNPDSFSQNFSANWGNNVLTFDEVGRQCLFIPKSVRQTAWHIAGLAPNFRTLDDGQPKVASLQRLKFLSWSLVWIFVIGNLAFPVYLWIASFRQCLQSLEPAIGTAEDDSAAAPSVAGVLAA
jgi:hypothetical protein